MNQTLEIILKKVNNLEQQFNQQLNSIKNDVRIAMQKQDENLFSSIKETNSNDNESKLIIPVTTNEEVQSVLLQNDNVQISDSLIIPETTQMETNPNLENEQGEKEMVGLSNNQIDNIKTDQQVPADLKNIFDKIKHINIMKKFKLKAAKVAIIKQSIVIKISKVWAMASKFVNKLHNVINKKENTPNNKSTKEPEVSPNETKKIPNKPKDKLKEELNSLHLEKIEMQKKYYFPQDLSKINPNNPINKIYLELNNEISKIEKEITTKQELPNLTPKTNNQINQLDKEIAQLEKKHPHLINSSSGNFDPYNQKIYNELKGEQKARSDELNKPIEQPIVEKPGKTR